MLTGFYKHSGEADGLKGYGYIMGPKKTMFMPKQSSA